MIFLMSNNISLLNCVPDVLSCQRALRAYVLTCQRVLRVYMLMYRLRTYVLTRCVLRAHVPKCSRGITTKNKNKFSITCFPYIFVIVLSFFFLRNKTVVHCCIALTRRKPLTDAITDFVQ